MRRHKLITIVFSHYNEKARWALDWCGVDYEERAFMPVFSHLGVLVATRGKGGHADSASTRFSTPVLVTREGESLCDSTAIARWASAQCGKDGGPLFPDPSVVEIVEAFGKNLGPFTRLAAYWHVLQTKGALASIANENVSRRQALAFRPLAPFVTALVRRGLRVDERNTRRAVERVRAQLVLAEERLARTPYLCGDRFTAADLTFAALLAPALLVTREEGYGADFPRLETFGPQGRALVDEVRGTRAGKFALDMFLRHRRETFRA